MIYIIVHAQENFGYFVVEMRTLSMSSTKNVYYTCHSNTGLSARDGESQELQYMYMYQSSSQFLQPTWTPAEFYVQLMSSDALVLL